MPLFSIPNLIVAVSFLLLLIYHLFTFSPAVVLHPLRPLHLLKTEESSSSLGKNDACLDREGRTRWNANDYSSASNAFYEIFPWLTDSSPMFLPGESICVLIVIPQSSYDIDPSLARISSDTGILPFPDQIRLTLTSAISRLLQISVSPEPIHPSNVMLYTATATLSDPGSYTVSVLLEYDSFKWDLANVGDLAYNTITIPPRQLVQRAVVVAGRTSVPDSTCTTGDAPGRWLDAKAYRTAEPTSEWAQSNYTNDFGELWVPNGCKLKAFKPEEVDKCLVERYPIIHWFGDSNSRRSLKLVSSPAHDNWCTSHLHSSHVREECECDDRFTDPATYIWTENPLQAVALAESPTGGTSLAHFHLFGGLGREHYVDWNATFANPQTNPAIVLARPALLVIAIGNWGASFTNLDEWVGLARIFLVTVRDAYKKAYNAVPPVVWRTPQPFCCMQPMQERRWTTGRVQLLKELMQRTLKQVFDEGEVRVWDVNALGTDNRANEAFDACPANHARPAIIRIENQILWNTLCGDEVA